MPVEEYKPIDVIFHVHYLSTFQIEVLKFMQIISSYNLHQTGSFYLPVFLV